MSGPPTTAEVEDKVSLHDTAPGPASAASDEVTSRKDSIVSSRDSKDLSTAHYGTIRSASSDTLSNVSVDEQDALREGRSIGLHPPLLHRHASRSPAPPRTFREKVKGSWIRNKGLFLMLFAQFFGTLMNVTARLLEREGNNGNGLHPFQILFARMAITLALASVYMWYTKTPDFPFGKKEVRLLLAARGIGGFFGVFGMYYSLLYLPLSDATVITFLAPSLACWACSILINEPFPRAEQIAGLVSLVGVVLIARPTSLLAVFHHSSESAPPASGNSDATPPLNGTKIRPDPTNDDHITPQQRLMAVGIALIGVMGAAIAYTTIRWIGKRAHPLISVNYFAIWCTVVSCVMMAVLPGVGFLFPANLKEWGMLIFLGICGFIMQFLLAAALAYEKSSRVTNMTYTQMIFALLFDKLVFNASPGVMSIIGSSLILGSATIVALQKDGPKAKEQNKEESGRASSEEEIGLVDGQQQHRDLEEGGQYPLREVQARTLR